ncbi:MAG TPA: retention module-containing protein, partial [Burkholderiales bacterium]|nr:retention module-containing protein [Burkholderiales bacterium]
MATVSNAKAEVGTIKVAIGDVRIVGVDGIARVVGVGDKVYAKEVIQTAANAVVQVQLTDGRMLDLGRDSQIALDDDVLGATRAAANTADSVAELQAKIAAGADPSTIGDPAAAGGTPGAVNDEGSHEAIVINQANSLGPVTAGYITNPIAIAFEQPILFSQLPAAPPPNEPPAIIFNVTPAELQVNEAGLLIGSDPSSPSEITKGTFTISDPNGIADITIVTINGQPIALSSLTGTAITTPMGEMTINSYDPHTGVVSFTYELKTPVIDVPNQPEQDIFTVTVTDSSNSESAPATLKINIVDDVATARNDSDSVAAGTFGPETGNVITAAGTTSGAPGADTPGADSATLTGIASTNVPGNSATSAGGILTINGQYGVLTIQANGDYSYTRNAGTPGGVVDTFRYTLTDGDGDPAAANLTINIGDSTPNILNIPAAGTPGAQVNEAGLPTGSDAAASSETTTGAITFNAKDGPAVVTLDGVAVTGTPGQTFAGEHGLLTVTGYSVDPVTGNGALTYSYTLTQNTAGDTTFDDFAVVVTDKDGDPASATLKINIVDDVATARNDSDSVAAGTFGPETGNVITAAGTTSGAPGADTPGADSATLTGIASTNVPGNSATSAGGILTING